MPTGFDVRGPLWYNNGVWGALGYAVPNFGNNPTSLNGNILEIVALVGKNVQALMVGQDAALTVPPSINTIIKMHRLVLRLRQLLGGRQVLPGTPNMEGQHAQPAEAPFLLFPTPYFKIRNPHLKRYCGFALDALCEAMNHTENRKAIEISPIFSALVGQYFARIYRELATELCGIAIATASDPAFVLSDDQLKAYDPSKFFTVTELTDEVAGLDDQPSPANLGVLARGIPATLITNLAIYPTGEAPRGVSTVPHRAPETGDDATTSAGSAAAGTDGAATPPAFASPPGSLGGTAG